MISELEERIKRVQEDAIVSKLTSGMTLYGACVSVHIMLALLASTALCTAFLRAESNSRKRKCRGSEFILLEKRKKPVTVNDILSLPDTQLAS